MSENGGKKDTSWGTILLAAVLIVVGYYGWQYYKRLPSSEPVVYERSLSVAPMSEREVTVNKDYIGYVTPINEVNVRPYINGFINDIMVVGGSEVKIGDVLLVIDQSEYLALLDAAKAAVARAEADFNNSSTYYQRVNKAGARAVSKTEIDNAMASFLSAKAALSQAKASLAQAEVNYNYTIIDATIDGIVGNVSLSKGDYVSPQNMLLSIIQYNPIRVVFSITDKDYLDEAGRGKMFDDEKIRLKLANGKIYEQPGEFKYADNQIDKATNSIAVYADFVNLDKKLVANAYVDVLVEKKYSGIVLRKDLIYLQPDGNYVYVAEGDNISQEPAEILSDYGNNYILKNTFKPNAKIVLDKLSARDKDQKFKIVVKDGAAAEEKN